MKQRHLSYQLDSFMCNSSNINGFAGKTIMYNALDTFKLAVENSNNTMVDNTFTEIMSVYNLRSLETTKSILNQKTFGDKSQKTNEGINDIQTTTITSMDIEQIAMKRYELICSHIAGFNNDKLHFTLEQSKKWIYAVIYNEITQNNALQLYILKSFLTTINIIFLSQIKDDILADDLNYILILLESLQKPACTLKNSKEKVENNNSENVVSMLFCLGRSFNKSFPMPQELVPRLKNVKNERINANEIWHKFLIDEYGLIDESVRLPCDQTVNTSSAIHAELKLRDSDSTGSSPAINGQQSQSFSSININNIKNLNIVTHLVPFHRISIEDAYGIDIKNSICNCDNDYQELFKSPTIFQRPGFINSNRKDTSNLLRYATALSEQVLHQIRH